MGTKRKGNRSITRRVQATFCLCFPTTVSDDDDIVTDTYSKDGRNHPVSFSERVNDIQDDFSAEVENPASSSSPQPFFIARDFRSRLAMSAAATTQQPESSGLQDIRRSTDDADDGCYRVHTSVDYTNCLVPALNKIIAAPYYWGIMNRYEAEDLLENKPEGTFLLRDSAQTEYLFSVSFRRYKRTLHARIEQKNHHFSFDFSDTALYSATTITDLITYYNDPVKCLFFEPQLTIPLPRNYVFSLQALCRAAIASLTTYDGVDKLNLPQALKNYLKEYFYKHPVKTTNYASGTGIFQNDESRMRQYRKVI